MVKLKEAPVPVKNQNRKLEDMVNFWILHINKQILALCSGRIRRLGLTVSAIQALSLLAEHEGVTVSELSELAFIAQPTLTKMLNRLEADKLVRRKSSNRDKRLTQNYITPAGKKLLQGMWEVIDEGEEHTLRGFTSTQVEELMGYLKSIDQNLARR